jgi:hypothetical protein
MNTFSRSLLVLLAAVLIGFGLYTYKHGATVSGTNIVQASSTPKKFTKETDSLSVDITYPSISGTGKGVANANLSIETDIAKQIDAFEKDANGINDEDITLPKDIKSTVSGSPAVEEINSRYESIFMGMEWYARGAAHPSHSINTYMYDYKNQKLISVSDLFKPGSNYLNLLSTLSKEDLKAQADLGDLGYSYDETFVDSGTAPKAENFDHILPLKDGLAIYFDEYQVGPYVLGPQQVVIPYAKLKDVISPDGVLQMYIQ